MTDQIAPPAFQQSKSGVEVLPPVDLSALAKQINDNHNAIVSAVKSVVTKAIAAGEALIAAKAKVEADLGYGHWGRWLKGNIAASPRTVQAYMQLAEGKLPLEAMLRDSSATVAQLTFNGALDMIREHKAKVEVAPAPAPPSELVNSELVELKEGFDRDLHIAELAHELLRTLRTIPKEVATQRAHRLVERLQEEKLIG